MSLLPIVFKQAAKQTVATAAFFKPRRPLGWIEGSTIAGAAIRAWIAIAALFMFGCAPKALPTKNETMPPIVVATVSDAGIKDLRHLYRAAFCAQLPAESSSCEELILRLPGEANPDMPLAQRDIAERYRIGF